MLATVCGRGLLALSVLTVAFPPLLSLAESVDETPVLVPVKIDDFLAQNGLRRRAPSDVRNLDLQKRSDLIYGTPNGDEQPLLTHMVVYAPDGMHTISMDTFESLTTAVDCQGDDGMLSMSFVSKEAYDYALRQWAWINDADEDRFVLVTDHDGCGPDQQRQAYIISRVENDESSLTTYLTAEPKDLVDAFDKYDIDFGYMDYTRSKMNRERHLRKRGPRDPNLDAFSALNLHDPDAESEPQADADIEGKVADIENDDDDETAAVLGGANGVREEKSLKVNNAGIYDIGDVENVEKDEDVPARSTNATRQIILDIAAGNDKATEEVLHINHLGLGLSATLQVECDGCHFRGKLMLAGHFEIDGKKPPKMILEASPSDFSARMVLRNAFRVPFDSPKFPGRVYKKHSKELYRYPMPGAGFVIPGVISIGATKSYWLGLETTIAGGANFTWGYQASLPNTAKVTINLMDKPIFTHSGFEGGSFEPVFDLHSFQGTVRFSGSSSWKLLLGISMKKIGDYEVGFRFLLPDGGILFTYVNDERGACDSQPGTSNEGVFVDSYIGSALDLTVKFGHESFMYPFVRLFGYWWPIYTDCYSFLTGSKEIPAPKDGPGIADGSGPLDDISTDEAMYLRDAPDPKSRFNDGVGFEYGQGVENANELEGELVDELDTIMEDNFEMPNFEGDDGS